MTAKLLKLKTDRAAAFAKAQECEKRTKAKDATPEQLAAASTEWDEALASVESFDAEIATEEQEANAQAAAALNRRNRMSAIQGRAGPRSLQRNASASTSVLVSSVRDLAAEDPNRGFRSPRDFFLSVMNAGMGQAMDERLAPLHAAAGSDEQGEYSNPFGGFLVPVGFQPNLMELQAEGDPTAGRTMQVPMSTPKLLIDARTDKDHSTSVTGGLRVYRRKETQAVEASRMQIEQIELSVNSLMGVNYQTEELLQDSPISVAAIIQRGFQTEIGSKILDEKIRGTGAGEMLGVLNAGNQCLISVDKQAGQQAATIVADNVIDMRARCWRYGQAIWLANHDTLPQLCKLSITIGTTGFPIFLTGSGDVPDTLMGRPIFFTEYAEALGTKGDLILGVWSEYLEGSIGGVESAESVHVRFLNNERAFRMSMRNDGRPWWRSPLTPKKGTVGKTLSPFVALNTRA